MHVQHVDGSSSSRYSLDRGRKKKHLGMNATPLNTSLLRFCTYQATLANVEVSFWATADEEDANGRRIDPTLGAVQTSEPSTLPAELFAGQSVGENMRCGNVWSGIPPLIASMEPIIDRLLATAACTPAAASCTPQAPSHTVRMPPCTPQAPSTRVLELGAGMGLPGLWAAARGTEVILTDSNLPVLELLRRNAGFLGDREPTVRSLDWSQPPDWVCEDIDLVIASDVIYEQAAIVPLIGVAAAALRPGGTLLLSHTERGIVSFDDALERADLEGLSWTAQTGGSDDGEIGSIAVHTFQKGF